MHRSRILVPVLFPSQLVLDASAGVPDEVHHSAQEALAAPRVAARIGKF